MNGENGAGRDAGTYSATFSATLKIGESGDDSIFLPVTIRGEMPGRAMSDYLRCQVAFANS
ncbi:hypothetical protein, partial [Mesorhizobium captivum]